MISRGTRRQNHPDAALFNFSPPGRSGQRLATNARNPGIIRNP